MHMRKGAMGGGFYAIDKELRSRFGEFPILTADDKFTRNLAKPSERQVVDACHATVTMPQTFGVPRSHWDVRVVLTRSPR